MRKTPTNSAARPDGVAMLPTEAAAAHTLAEALRAAANVIDSVALHPTFHRLQLVPLMQDVQQVLGDIDIQAGRLVTACRQPNPSNREIKGA